MEGHDRADEALDVEDGLAAVQLDALADQDQTIAGADGTAETDVLQSAEADEITLHETLRDSVIAAQLGRRLAHQYARHEWIIGHVPAHPELIHTNIPVAGDDTVNGIQVDDRRQLLHLEALGIDFADRFLIGQYVSQIQPRRIEMQFGWHGNS